MKQLQLIDNDNLLQAHDVLRALSHPVRLSILLFIDKQKETNVNKIYNTLRLEQSITSQHLKILRNAGVVKTTRDGKFIHYSLNYKKISKDMKSIHTFLKKD